MNITCDSHCRGKRMKSIFSSVLLLVIVMPGCRHSTTGPTEITGNLLVNPSFEANGMPSLQGWTVSDTSNVHFSAEMPTSGSGHTIVLSARWFAPWPNGANYQMLSPPAGTFRFRLSVYGKRIGLGGGVDVNLGSPLDTNSVLRMSLNVRDTLWAFYSISDTMTVRPNDVLYVTISGGGTEIVAGTTFFNSCTLEKLN